MKVLIATGIYPPDIGGPATYSKLLHDELPKRNISVKVLSFGEIRGWPKGIRHFLYFLKLLRHSPFFDIIYAQDPVSVGLPAFLASVFLRKRFILKVVGNYAWEQGTARYGITKNLDEFSKENRGYPFFVRVLKTIQALVARGADTIVTPSEYLKKIVNNWGVSKEKIIVVYNSFEGVTDIKGYLGKENNEEKIIFSAGRLVPWKGFITLIALVADLKKHFPKIKLLIAGDGPQKDFLHRSINESSLSGEVFLLGGLDKDKLYRYIKGADVFVLNTSYEGFSHQLLEVMALGTPIVTTNAGGNPELIKSGFNGLLVAPDDRQALSRSIESVLLDEELAKELSTNGLKTVKNFTIEKMLDETVKALQK